MVVDTRGVRKQRCLFALRLLIIKRLVVRESLRWVHDVDHSAHIRVDETNKLEVSDATESDGVGWRAYRIVIDQENSSGNARGPIKARWIRCKTWTSDGDSERGAKGRGSCLAWFQEG